MPTFSDIPDQLVYQAIELPSWAFGNSGTRFKVFGSPGTPRTVQEKIADAAKVNELTGLAPKVALHIPWDKVEDYGALREYAADLGVALGTINSNTFQDDIYKFGSLTHIDEAVRRKAIDHHRRGRSFQFGLLPWQITWAGQPDEFADGSRHQRLLRANWP